MESKEDIDIQGDVTKQSAMNGDNVIFDHCSYNREEQEKVEAVYGDFILRQLLDKISELSELKDNIKIELCNQRILSILDGFQENPKLMDCKLDEIVNLLLSLVKNRTVDDVILHRLMKIFYLLVKTRGEKIVSRMFPHATEDLQIVLVQIEALDPADYSQWETRYIYMLWLSILCIIPFDISRFDDGNENLTYAQRIVNMGKVYVMQCDKSSDAASLMLSKFLTRDDIKSPHLADFMGVVKDFIDHGDTSTMIGNLKMVGYMRTLALMFKHGKRIDMIKLAPSILESLIEMRYRVVQNSVLNKLRMKVVQRLGLTLMKSRVAKWRYDRGRRTLEAGDNGTLVVPPVSTDKVSPRQTPQQGDPQTNDEEECIEVPDEIESVIEELMGGLRDKDTVVRWSAAKGIGRVTNLLDKESANDVIEIVLGLFDAGEMENSWHGGCLTLAELARRGLLLPEFLPIVSDILVKALNFDERRGNFSVGSNVRDAACYVCWSFARAYHPNQIKPYINQIACALIITMLFDREVNVRRAASAAFQENVGRQGSFPHGIDIINACDYFAVGNRNQCFNELCLFVGKFGSYTKSMVDDLTETRIFHWDIVVRELCAEAVFTLCSCNIKYMAGVVLERTLPMCLDANADVGHGAVLIVYEIIRGVGSYVRQNNLKIETFIKSEVIDDIRNLISELKKRKLFTGNGRDNVQVAACRLVEAICEFLYLLKCDDAVIRSYKDFIEDSVKSNIEKIQIRGIESTKYYMKAYILNANGQLILDRRDAFLDTYTVHLEDTLEHIRVGCTMCLGAIPKFSVAGRLDPLVQSLLRCVVGHVDLDSAVDKHFGIASRIAGVKAITRLLQTLTSSDQQNVENLSASNIELLFKHIYKSLRDYTIDHRGDIGAHNREAAIKCLLVYVDYLDCIGYRMSKETVTRIFAALMKQACEKIDKIRETAGSNFAKLLYHEPPLDNVHEKEMKTIFNTRCCKITDWMKAESTFQLFTKLLINDDFIYHLLEGLAVSIGGLTESLSKHARVALVDYCNSIHGDSFKIRILYNNLLQVLKDNARDSRVTIPLLRMIIELFTRNVFVELYEENVHGEVLLEVLKNEMFKCTETQKLINCGEMYICMLDFVGLRKKVLSRILILIGHKFPIIRRAIAMALYEKVMMLSEPLAESEEKNDALVGMLGDTVWDAGLETVRKSRNEVMILLNIPLLKAKSLCKQ